MTRERYIALWWVPLVLALTPALGLVPAPRDVVDFFAPIRAATASSLTAGILPWLNIANGCGEAWFANPETAVLYPPVWIHLVAAPEWAMALEIALHLAWLSLGTGLLASRLGTGPRGRSLVEAASWSVGPVVFSVGVLNNLETLAWMPWMVLAARAHGSRSVPLVALTTGLAWLGGEPQLWAAAVVLTLLAARSRLRTAAGVALGTLLVAFQMVPFLFWVLEGDRGAQAAQWVLRGAVTPADWRGLLVPGLPVDPDRMIYVESFFFGAPLVVCGALGAWRKRWLLIAAAGLGLIAMLPEVGGGGVFLTLTGGLVRYPSRFALLGLALLVPLMGVGAEDWLAGKGRWLATVVAALTLLLCFLSSNPLRWLVAGAPAVLMLAGAASSARREIRAVALLAGLVGAVIAALPLLDLKPAAVLEGEKSLWPEVKSGERIYAPTPSAEVMPWLAGEMESRRLWPVGYLNLVDGLTLVRTDSPVANGRLAGHLEVADRGAESRWWLDALAAKWVILQEGSGIPENMESVRVRGGMRLLRNRRAMMIVSLDSQPPQPDMPRQPIGRVDQIGLGSNGCRVTFDAGGDGFAWVSVPAVEGWRWSLDDARIELEQGPGIVQFFEVGEGRHLLIGRYRPPGFVPAAAASAAAAILVVFLLWRGRRSEPSREG